MAYATVNGRQWYYDLQGPRQAPVVILANGALADARSWINQVALLSKRYRVLSFDFSGQGRSESLEVDVTVSAQAHGLAALLKTLQIERAHLIGVSYGGEVGLSWALDHPEQALSLIIADSVARVDANLALRVEAWLAAARAGDPELLFQVTLPDIFSPAFIGRNAPFIENARRGYHSLDLVSVVHLLKRFREHDLTDRLPRLRIPALLLCGELDTLKPPGAMRTIADRLSNAEFLTVPAAGHALPLEKPEAFMTACLGFLTKQEG